MKLHFTQNQKGFKTPLDAEISEFHSNTLFNKASLKSYFIMNYYELFNRLCFEKFTLNELFNTHLLKKLSDYEIFNELCFEKFPYNVLFNKIRYEKSLCNEIFKEVK